MTGNSVEGVITPIPEAIHRKILVSITAYHRPYEPDCIDGDVGLCRADLQPPGQVFVSVRKGEPLEGASVSLPRIAAMIRQVAGGDRAKSRQFGLLAAKMAEEGCQQ